MPGYVSKHARLVVGDVAFHPNTLEAADHDAARAAIRAQFAPDAAVVPDELGASYDARLAYAPGLGTDFVAFESQADRDAAEAQAEAEKAAKAEKAAAAKAAAAKPAAKAAAAKK